MPDKHKNTPLHLGVLHKKFPHTICKLLLENGAKVDSLNSFGSTPLMELVKSNSESNIYDVASLLLEFNADPNYIDPYGQTILMLINPDIINCTRIVELLLNSGAGLTINNVSIGGSSALTLVSRKQNCVKLIELLLEYGADPRVNEEKIFKLIPSKFKEQVMALLNPNFNSFA